MLETALICCQGLLKGLRFVPDVRIESMDWIQQALQSRDDSSRSLKHYVAYVQDIFPKLNNSTLIDRLARTIRLRRQYLQYIREHKNENSLLDSTSQPGRDPRTVSESREQDRETSPLDQIKRAGCSKTDCEECGSSDSRDSLQDSSAWPVEFPRLLTVKDEHSDSFITKCPICDEIQNIECDLKWRKHVLGDLRAYVCTFGNPECYFRLFNNSRAWMEHELQSHRLQWVCPFIICNNSEPLLSAEKFRHHILEHPEVGGETPANTIEVLEAASRYPAQLIAPRDCPFCDDWEQIQTKEQSPSPMPNKPVTVSTDEFRRHVSRHMEHLVLSTMSITTSRNNDEKSSGQVESGKDEEKPVVQTKEITDTKEEPSATQVHLNLIDDSFTIALGKTSKGGYRVLNDPAARYQRQNVIENPRVLKIQCESREIVHGGFSDDSDKYATLLVYDIHLHSTKRSRRIISATVQFEFSSSEPGRPNPRVHAIAPKTWSLSPSTQEETTMVGGELNASMPDMIANVGATAKWEESVSRTTNDQAQVTGLVSSDEYGRPVIAEWRLHENSSIRSGVPSFLRCAILLERSHEGLFECKVTIDVNTDWKTKVERLLRPTPRDDPMLFNPEMDPTNNLRKAGYDMDNLGRIDLHNEFAAIQFSTAFVPGKKLGE
ncbi:hypothetical protein QBC38DRAFT_186495 [Podospora fimiseda]|uniref:C2H2-type domain-containing protein n=1 Tax=Podospora fimiseda TaxID=252190 RepID=A0AAN6YQM0_9PEZI|nr:hypothetical protein QBC38DRAFT_186495 [Podospora fimiseda]